MKILASIACLMCFVALTLGASTTGTLTGKKVSITIDPAGAKVQFYQTGTNTIFTHTFTQIQEVASDGGVVNAVNSFADLTFNNPSTPQQQLFQGINATQITLTGTIPVSSTSNGTVSASLNMNCYVFNEPGKVNYGSKTYSVDVGSVEVVYSISGWPVASTSNKLNLRVHIATPGRTGSWQSPELRLFDGASIIFAPQSFNSDGTQNVAVSAVNGDSSVDITMQFKASNNIDYDPLFTVEAASGAAAVLRPFYYDLF